jgi:hypothetical protein
MAPYNNDPPSDPADDELVRREAAKAGLTETKYRMMRAANTDVVQSIVWDHVGRADVTRPSSMATTPSGRAPKRGTGWVEPRPLTKQPGIDIIDEMVERQTAKERIREAQDQLRASLEMKKYEEMQRDKKG